ncbi:flavin reductase family protein [Halomonas stenophila]|uniref:Flavin reductase (DIM6/NTAB) family NADH-FMN oxidoreductase RutF n=1 Tax=Halomonas stenophila TaxID=795312 RepID=A0A7W5EU11_9GAMM|nr:flavin reductase family protein [Halomonas stenophila]MBB3231452.1 flavin reductase (DIM6/NTAB) family NADH-FMN oxidoreductase RutF [Halomonas stenophila]
MEFDFSQLSKQERYKLLVSFIVPRPIALVTTMDQTGVSNAGPMSFFNVFGDEPPILILGIQHRPDGRYKDTTRNIHDNGEFVVNLVNERIAHPMITTSLDFPPEEDEVSAAGLTLAPSRTLLTGRILEAPVAMECRKTESLEYPNRSVIVGEVLHMHVQDEFIDPRTLRVRPEAYHPLARLHADAYLFAETQFELPRPSLEAFQATRDREACEDTLSVDDGIN